MSSATNEKNQSEVSHLLSDENVTRLRHSIIGSILLLLIGILLVFLTPPWKIPATDIFFSLGYIVIFLAIMALVTSATDYLAWLIFSYLYVCLVFVLIYYSHSMRIYGTSKEVSELRAISEHFSGIRIVNPGARIYRDKWSSLDESSVMRECFLLINQSALVVFSEFRGFIGRGVWQELMHAFISKKPVVLLRDGEFYCVEPDDIEVIDEGDDWVRFARVVNLHHCPDSSHP